MGTVKTREHQHNSDATKSKTEPKVKQSVKNRAHGQSKVCALDVLILICYCYKQIYNSAFLIAATHLKTNMYMYCHAGLIVHLPCPHV